MCAIIGWSGKMPKGYISRLLTRAETRGRDSVGLAFRLEGVNKAYRLAATATEFVNDKDTATVLSDARRSLRGLAHTRRASPGMPIDERNAHPFPYWKYFFAHNGKIQNWKEIRAFLETHFQSEVTRLTPLNTPQAKTAEYCLEYVKKATTDSMVLGPYIDMRDFSSVLGCMGLVWLKAGNLYVFRYAKEVVTATIAWRYTKADTDESPEDQVVTMVASTDFIIKAIEKVPDIEFDLGEITTFTEGKVFRVEPTGLVDEGTVPTNAPVEDAFTSEVVEPESEATSHEAAITS